MNIGKKNILFYADNARLINFKCIYFQEVKYKLFIVQ